MAVITLLSLISACHISLLIRILALIIQFHGFPLLCGCFWLPEGIITAASGIIDENVPLFIKVSYWGLSFAQIFISLLDNPRDDGIECRLIDDVLTKYRFHRLAELNRIFDRFRTPRRDGRVVDAFAGLWIDVLRIIYMVYKYDIYMIYKYDICNGTCRHCGRDDGSKIPTSDALRDLRQGILEFIQSTDSYCDAIDLHREAVDHFRTPADNRSASNDNQCCDDLYSQIEALVERVERLRDRCSKMSVWKRAWCRPLVEHFSDGLKPLLMDIILEELDGPTGEQMLKRPEK